jgi:hypothetical protein
VIFKFLVLHNWIVVYKKKSLRMPSADFIN